MHVNKPPSKYISISSKSKIKHATFQTPLQRHLLQQRHNAIASLSNIPINNSSSKHTSMYGTPCSPPHLFHNNTDRKQKETSAQERRDIINNYYLSNIASSLNNMKHLYKNGNNASTGNINSKQCLNKDGGVFNNVGGMSSERKKMSKEGTNLHLQRIPSEYFDYEDEKQIELSKEEKDIYGSREMKGYQKVKVLGKGGCGIVFLAIDKETNSEVAIKQISKKAHPLYATFSENNTNIARNEINILSTLNTFPKCKYIADIYTTYEDNSDIWLAFEKCGKCLSNLSFKIKGEFIKTERIYSIKKGKFIKLLFTHINQFKILIRDLLLAIDFINSKGIIHADIKPENILIEYIDDNTKFSITQVKVIDFGSAFYASNPNSISSNTPEYLCPELTEIIEGTVKRKKNFINDLQHYVSCVDIWSLGVTLLEIVLACPVWMSYKAKVVINGKVLFKNGLFGFKGRDSNKIHNKQIEVSQNLHKLLSQSLICGFEHSEKESFEDLLSKMLNGNYKERITTQQALHHPFLSNITNI